MTELINKGSGERTHVQSPLMRESLMDRRVLVALTPAAAALTYCNDTAFSEVLFKSGKS